MHRLRHEVDVVGADWPSAFDLCLDVGGWPAFMPAVRHGRVIARDGAHEVIEIEAEVGPEIRRWRSQRTVDRAARVIHFVNLSPPAPVTRLQGLWRFEPAGGGVQVSLEHELELADEDALDRVTAAIRKNVTRDLQGMKALLEAGHV